MLMDAAGSLPASGGLTGACCTAPGLSRASLYRRQDHRRKPLSALRPRPTPSRALIPCERQSVLDVLRELRFADLARAEIYASLPGEGICMCSIRTMYRILARHDEVRERRHQLRHPGCPTVLHGRFLSDLKPLMTPQAFFLIASYPFAIVQQVVFLTKTNEANAVAFDWIVKQDRVTASHYVCRLGNCNGLEQDGFRLQTRQPEQRLVGRESARVAREIASPNAARTHLAHSQLGPP